MPDLHDLKMFLRSQSPIVVVESHEEKRIVEMFVEICAEQRKPVWKWTVTDGFQRAEKGFVPQRLSTTPTDVLKHIKTLDQPALILLLDFHPYLDDPLHIRLIREIAQSHFQIPHHLVLLSPEVEIPKELAPFTAKFQLTIPNQKQLLAIITRVAREWCRSNPGKRVVADNRAVQLLSRNLLGLTISDAERLARKAIYDDGAITKSDIQMVMQAKYELISQNGVLSFEYETARFADVGGLQQLKRWLTLRKAVFQGSARTAGIDPPKGVLLLGVQGCGKSLAAKATAGIFGVPLLRLDFGALYNKYMGETEKNLRESLTAAETMSPCVLWIDEMEKGLATGDSDDGVSRRVLGTLLTWMAEKKNAVFLVATCNDVTSLPPELLRKGRFDEIFFVDLPDTPTRCDIFKIQLAKRNLKPENFDIQRLAELCEGFSGSEIEQAVISALYVALASERQINEADIAEEIGRTSPLSVVMSEKITWLREWAQARTVPAH